MEGISCTTEGGKAKLRCGARCAIASEMIFSPLSFVTCQREVTAQHLTITHVRGRLGGSIKAMRVLVGVFLGL